MSCTQRWVRLTLGTVDRALQHTELRNSHSVCDAALGTSEVSGDVKS